LIGVILIYAGIWSLGSSVNSNHILVSSLNQTIWYALGFIALGTLISFILRDRAIIVAGWALSLSLGCAIFSILTGLSNPAGVLVFLIPTLFTIILLSRNQAAIFLILVIASSLFLNIAEYGRSFYQLEVVIPIMIIVSVTILLELILNELRGNYEWYQQRYQSALINEQIIRDNEAKLEKLVNNLNDYKKHLTNTNILLIKARDEAEQARNVKQNFVQNVSHELRTPLNLIIGFSETMVNAPQSYGEVNWTPDLRGDIECIYQNSQHLKALIDDVLDLAALENKKYEIEPSDVDLNSLIQEVVMITEITFKAKGLYLDINLDPNIQMVHIDSIRIKQVLLNLLSNALKYTKKGGVKISTKLNEDMAEVRVRDTGKGIPEDDLTRVFDAFYQVDKANNREDTGTGLGLSISKQLIELHGGEMWISSVFGKGTTVTFTIPVIE
jgi:signal transduction histidine kinase